MAQSRAKSLFQKRRASFYRNVPRAANINANRRSGPVKAGKKK